MRVPFLAGAVLALSAAAALADHPGEHLDEEMAAREPAFEAIDVMAPDFGFADAQGGSHSLIDLAEQIVVLALRPADCRAPCDEQLALFADVQGKVEVGGMAGMVEFVTVAADDPGAVLDPSNWIDLGADETGVQDMAAAYAAMLAGDSGGEPVTYVLDRGGRLAAAFHGTDFNPLNLLLYVNGLTTAPHPANAG